MNEGLAHRCSQGKADRMHARFFLPRKAALLSVAVACKFSAAHEAPLTEVHSQW